MKRAVLFAAAFAVAGAFGQSVTATKAYVEKKFAEATNAIPSIVTNKVVVESKWVVARKSPMSGLYTIGEPYYIGEEREMGFPEWAFYMQSTNVWGGLEMDGLDYADGGENATYLYFHSTGLEMQKKITTRNALGLAKAKDLEKLPTHEMVTNVARAVSNSFWDEKNEVLWRMEFRDGEPMFVPVTNENVKATGGVL